MPLKWLLVTSVLVLVLLGKTFIKLIHARDQLTSPDSDCHSEIGMDLNNLKAKKVAVYTDSTVSGQRVLDRLM